MILDMPAFEKYKEDDLFNIGYTVNTNDNNKLLTVVKCKVNSLGLQPFSNMQTSHISLLEIKSHEIIL